MPTISTWRDWISIPLTAGRWARPASGRVGLQAAWIHKYDIGIPTAGGVNTFEGAGSRNAGNEVGRPLPEWKINGTLNWSLNNHNVFLIVKHVDGYRHDTPQKPFLIAVADRELGVDLNTPIVERPHDGRHPVQLRPAGDRLSIRRGGHARDSKCHRREPAVVQPDSYVRVDPARSTGSDLVSSLLDEPVIT